MNNNFIKQNFFNNKYNKEITDTHSSDKAKEKQINNNTIKILKKNNINDNTNVNNLDNKNNLKNNQQNINKCVDVIEIEIRKNKKVNIDNSKYFNYPNNFQNKQIIHVNPYSINNFNKNTNNNYLNNNNNSVKVNLNFNIQNSKINAPFNIYSSFQEK